MDQVDGMDAQAAAAEGLIQKWLDTAIEGLGPSAKERVRAELLDHFAQAIEDRIAGGTAEADAATAALEEFGDARTARAQLRRFYLTERQEKLVRGRLDMARLYESQEPAPPLPWSARILAGLLMGGPILLVLGLLLFFQAKTLEPVLAMIILALAVPFLGILALVFAGGKAAKKAAAQYRQALRKHDAAWLFHRRFGYWMAFELVYLVWLGSVIRKDWHDDPPLVWLGSVILKGWHGDPPFVLFDVAILLIVEGITVFQLWAHLSIWRKLRRLPPPVVETLFQQQPRRQKRA